MNSDEGFVPLKLVAPATCNTIIINTMKLIRILSIVSVSLALGSAAFAEDKKFTEGSCCDKAKKAGKECAHPCCVKATEENKVCEKCNKKK